MLADFKYKEYTPEEDMIYDETISKVREGLRNGLTFKEACSVINVEDIELKRFIVDDALKIMIAEMHYAKGMPFQQVADALKVSLKVINIAHMEMLEDAEITASDIYIKSNPEDLTGNA